MNQNPKEPTNNGEENQRGSPQISWKPFLFVLLAVVLLWCGYWSMMAMMIPEWNSAATGPFGDSFGALNTLLSAAAFSALFFTMFLQMRQIAGQGEDSIRAQRLQSQSARALERQAAATESSLRLAAMNSLVQSISIQLAHTKDEDRGDREFLNLELRKTVAHLVELIDTEQNRMAFGDVGVPFSSKDLEECSDREIVNLISKSVPYLTVASIQAEIPGIKDALARNGVISRRRLEMTLSARQIISDVERIYVELLWRRPDRPLDPRAVVTWGPMLFVKPGPARIAELTNILTNCKEAQDKKTKCQNLKMLKGQKLYFPVALVFLDGSVQPSPNYVKAKALRDSESNNAARTAIFIYDWDKNDWEEMDGEIGIKRH